MSPDILIAVNNLSRRYGPRLAVKNLNFSLHRGEILGFLGPNGAGKSTTMNILSGCLSPDSGSVEIYGQDLCTQAAAAKRHIGYLPEQAPLYVDMQVDAYLDFCGALHGMAGKPLRIARQNIKQRCGLAAVGKRRIAHLSKGYRQRLGIAQALLHDPAVLLLDEPTSGLDPAQLREIRDLIVELGRERAIILSTHILPEVISTCQRVMILFEGELMYQGSLQELTRTTGRLRLRLQASLQPEQLTAIADIAAATRLPDGTWSLAIAPDANPAPAIAQLAANQGWGLLELAPEQHSLEQLFLEMTSGERPQANEVS